MAQQHADAYPRKHFFFEMFTGLARFRGRARTWVSSTLRQLSPFVVDG